MAAVTRVNRGTKISPIMWAVTTHISKQNGQVRSSPIACRKPLGCRTSYFSSAGPAVPWYRVKGARNGLVAAVLLRVRESL